MWRQHAIESNMERRSAFALRWLKGGQQGGTPPSFLSSLPVYVDLRGQHYLMEEDALGPILRPLILESADDQGGERGDAEFISLDFFHESEGIPQDGPEMLRIREAAQIVAGRAGESNGFSPESFAKQVATSTLMQGLPGGELGLRSLGIDALMQGAAAASSMVFNSLWQLDDASSASTQIAHKLSEDALATIKEQALAAAGEDVDVIERIEEIFKGTPTGGGRPVARTGDTTDHGGVITGGAAVTLLGDVPAARVGDQQSCPQSCGSTSHVGGPIATGNPTFEIEGLAASGQDHQAACVGVGAVSSVVCVHDDILMGDDGAPDGPDAHENDGESACSGTDGESGAEGEKGVDDAATEGQSGKGQDSSEGQERAQELLNTEDAEAVSQRIDEIREELQNPDLTPEQVDALFDEHAELERGAMDRDWFADDRDVDITGQPTVDDDGTYISAPHDDVPPLDDAGQPTDVPPKTDRDIDMSFDSDDGASIEFKETIREDCKESRFGSVCNTVTHEAGVNLDGTPSYSISTEQTIANRLDDNLYVASSCKTRGEYTVCEARIGGRNNVGNRRVDYSTGVESRPIGRRPGRRTPRSPVGISRPSRGTIRVRVGRRFVRIQIRRVDQ